MSIVELELELELELDAVELSDCRQLLSFDRLYRHQISSAIRIWPVSA